MRSDGAEGGGVGWDLRVIPCESGEGGGCCFGV